jgi:8-oxo-dGTP pyrophosphatase MutT (NUDIX family)
MNSHAQALATVLTRHHCADAFETACRDQMLTYLSTLPAPFSRDQALAHFTGSALLFDPGLERLCLVFHKKLNRWLQPGGHVDALDDFDIAKTAIREAREETGLSVELMSPHPVHLDVHTIPARADSAAHEHLDVRFALRALDTHLRHDPSESRGIAWFSREAAVKAVGERSFEVMLETAIRKRNRSSAV